ncbi:MAG TPA: diguanylate cyclase [Gemmatimonadales bacterium]|nr:diguanylate cyclase [Gemmatimonadales bacterium]
MSSWEQRLATPLRLLRLASVRNRVLVFALVATLIPSLTTAWVSYEQNKRSLTEKIAGELQGVGSQTAREIDLWVKERLYDLRVFASSYEVSENLERMPRAGGVLAPTGPAFRRLTDYLNSVRERFPDYAELLVVDPEGRVVATTAKRTPGTVRLPADWRTQLRNQNAVLGEPYREDAPAQDVVVFAVPIYVARGRLLGALTAKLRLRAVRDVLVRFAKGEAARVYLLKPEGHLIAGSSADAGDFLKPILDESALRHLGAHPDAAVEYRGLDGVPAVGVLRPVPVLHSAIVATEPAAEAFRQVTHLRNVTLGIVAALLVGIGLLGYFLGLLITRPLDRLTQGAAKVAAGDLAVDLPVVGGGELGYLTEAFNDMVRRLRESRRELERQSITDGLTGLYNRRHLMETLANEVRRSHRLRHTFALLMADVDRFKEYNDAHGHLAGDAALTRVAAILRECTRDVDCAARYGGEEFVVLMPETGAEGAVGIAERIRERLAADELVGEQLSFSIGVAAFPDDGESPEALITSADRALYQAKHEGRNRVVRAAGPPAGERRGR